MQSKDRQRKNEQRMRVQGSLTNSFKFEAHFFRFRNGEGIKRRKETDGCDFEGTALNY